ncbi:MAG TPA: Co2+/Mg2+ efflux protein ApaG [Gammaproteobacteria bacterium]|jgi:ApaG protein|nr:Co2+/Mg2+ efflux protein ApaG [Gammaproteobacteria bacterium]
MTDTSNDLPRSPISAAALRSTVEIKVVTQYLAAQSSPASSQYAFAYTVHITNNGNQSVQLIARRWLIVDDNDEVQEVAGEGVIGQKPHIAPGQSFHYTSGAILQTPFGTMRGDYEMITQSGERFLADIPPFLLSLPDSVH